LRPDDEAALAAPLRSSKPDKSESGRLHGSQKELLSFACLPGQYGAASNNTEPFA